MNSSVPTRQLRENPDFPQLRRQAKELLDAFIGGDANAVAEVRAHMYDADPATFALHDAQLAIARAYGFASWPRLRAFVEGTMVRRFEEAVGAGDTGLVLSMLKRRPELVNSGAARIAALRCNESTMRVLMDHGANARNGMYPHRDATSALAIARDRGYDGIVAVIEEAEATRRGVGTADPDEFFHAISEGENDRAFLLLEADPSLVHSRASSHGWTPLHVAAGGLNFEAVDRLLRSGANVNAKARRWTEQTPLDCAARRSDAGTSAAFFAVANRLLQAGAEMTPWAAVAMGDAGRLSPSCVNTVESDGGMLRIAASFNRADILQLLLDFGLNPNERTRMQDADADDVVFTWGMPLYHCAQFGKYEMAEILLKHGADPNGKVYASGDPMFQAYDKHDRKMVELLERYGGVPEATTAGLFRQTDLARRMLAGEARYGSEGVGGDTLAEQLLWGSACGGDAEIVRMALERVERTRDDPWWFHIMEQPIRMWSDGGEQLKCLKLITGRCDPSIRGRSDDGFNLTMLHSVAGARAHVTAEQRVAFADILLNAGARMDVRDDILRSTPLGWACRWGQIELVALLLQRGADPVEADADAWATPEAWAKKMGHAEVIPLLRGRG